MVSIRHGAGSGGDAAQAIGELYASVCESLHGVSLEHGSEAMATAAELAEAAIDNGLLYPGAETMAFLSGMGEYAREAHKEIGGPSARY